MNTEGIPSCEWPDAKRGATFRNCCDKDGRPDKNLERRAAENRIEAITKQLDCPHGLMTKKRKALFHEADRLKRMFKLGKYSPQPGAEIDERKEKATEEKLRWLGKKKGAQTNLQDG
jgi:hypothetical protein